ncbi:hypothetical protein Lesp02_22530 [Lentzea sp. NBRC 105346]|uniref:Ig-like domain-containing protein n=1 Tax=Lentzea sp. NBRC 105346 TaxID=3032205 RepID=UPI0024A3E7B9|nr:Ig-like domain-containing protein [Lentzea sp. NBRC 105346]GLZ30063.1 hypothetical protein Lesp02_22530 [Lentzea sp. NBRC 105346]
MRHFRMRAKLVSLLVGGLIGASVVAAPPALADSFVSTTFGPTGGEQTYTIPAGVTKLHVVAVGAPGGKGADGGDGSGPGGRRGHKVTAELVVPAGITKLVVAVGQQGGDGDGVNGGVPGFGGGARGGSGAPFAGGAGGGASDVRTCSAASPCDSLPTRLVVAAGGGGGGGRCFAISCAPSDSGGDGGDNSGGSPGIPGPGGLFGLPGFFGNGGAGGPGNPATAGGGGGGGGGGGWYGGGGGASGFQAPLPPFVAADGGKGGNGSDHAGPGTSNATVEETDEGPSVTISYLVESTSIAYTGPASGFTGDPVTLSARLTATTTGAPVRGPLTFRLNGTETCTAQTDANGVASCSITPQENAGTYPLVISYPGDVVHHPSSTQISFEVTRKPTTLTYTGALAGDYHDPATVSARLTITSSGAPVGDQPVTFKLNDAETCTAQTDLNGVASCQITPQEKAGTYPLKAEFAGSKGLLPSQTVVDFEVTKEETSLVYTGDAKVANNEPATLAAKLTEDDGTPVEGRTVSLTLGGTQSCVDTTDAAGVASCGIASVDQPLNATATVAVTAKFAGDDYYEPSQVDATVGLRYLTGRGFGVGAAPLLQPTPDTGQVRVARATTTSPPCVATISGVITARAVCASVVTTLAPGTSTATASVAQLSVGVVALRDITATSRSTCGGSTGNVTLGSLTVAGLPVGFTTAPNTTIPFPGGRIVLNEQVPVPGGLTVNGAHIVLPGVDVVVASATSDIHNC